eukprot:359821-Chlamydomonas_euryale.AAC.1
MLLTSPAPRVISTRTNTVGSLITQNYHAGSHWTAAMDVSLRAEHGYVAGVVAVSFLVHHMGLPISVMNARKKYGIKYPDLYASESNCKDAVRSSC